jgi:hypothetical protein
MTKIDVVAYCKARVYPPGTADITPALCAGLVANGQDDCLRWIDCDLVLLWFKAD